MPGVPFSGPTVLLVEEVAPNFTSSPFELQQVMLGSLVPVVSRALALALRQNSAFFYQHLRDLTLIQRVVYYSRDATAGKHTDSGLFTPLFQDETEPGEQASLKVYRGGTWIDVPGKKDEVVVNLGDTFQLWSNG
ncbi:Gibberellin 2-beta-dioxygenase 8 [Gracilariopsis chorda]|uniref:Gibberellin 2-beta-dioxygenase 8 n=1 Tax=Gracilariopsis chorda TaxID=448386 RepID=A0A2V3J2G5_9FLOR|nr:Gibberellin 2-beta-dioxygenase 8 [Gracilariopsis chorda]|eukprot:PXF47590.1 Gibberellin 2-beta-dioxygenase 8 [Gracilariopsis chorda]